MNLSLPILLALIIMFILILAISITCFLFVKYKSKNDGMVECTELLDKYIAILSSNLESKKRAELIKNWQDEVKNWNRSFNRDRE